MTTDPLDHLIFRAALGVALVGVIDDALTSGDVTAAERLLTGLLRKLPPAIADSCPHAARYLVSALAATRSIAGQGGGGHLAL